MHVFYARTGNFVGKMLVAYGERFPLLFRKAGPDDAVASRLLAGKAECLCHAAPAMMCMARAAVSFK